MPGKYRLLPAKTRALRQFVNILLALVAIGLLAACAGNDNPPTEVTVQLSQPNSSEFAGFYTAVEMGYYSDENLIVSLEPRSQTINPIAEVLAGSADFGISSGDQIIRAQSAGNDIIAIATIYQLNPLMIMSLPSDPVLMPEDLAGKRIGVNSANLDNPRDLQLITLLQKKEIDRTSVELLTTWDFFGAFDLTSGRLTAVSGFDTTKEAINAQIEGDEVTQLFFSDYDINIYMNPIFTNGYLTRSQPDLVNRFMRATLKGYQYAIENPAEAVQFCMSHDNTLDRDVQKMMLESQIPLIDPGSRPLGWMDETVWRITQDILLEQGIIPAPVDLSTVYTNLFVENAQ